MFHFVCKPADPHLDPKLIAGEAFDLEKPFMVVLEKYTKAGSAPHWHFHGHINPLIEQAKPRKQWLKLKNQSHSKKIIDSKCRPFVSRTDRCDEMGFAYCMKQPDTEVVYTSFDDNELEEWRAKSEEYVKEKKEEMPTWVRERLPKRPLDPPELHSEWRYLALEYYTEMEKQPPPRNQANVLWGMATTTGASTATKRYVSERI